MKFLVSFSLLVSLAACSSGTSFKGSTEQKYSSSSDSEANDEKDRPDSTVDGSAGGGKKGSTVDGSTGTPGKPGTVDGDTGSPMTESFEVATQRGKVDMFWVIDTSGSMHAETEEVKRNFKNFMASLAERIDIQVTLLADQALAIEGIASPHLQIPVNVQSNHGMQIAAAAICPAESTQIESGNQNKIFCGEPATRVLPTRMPSEYIGKAIPRLRDDADKVFVFVTDDNATGMVTPANFLTLTKLPANTTRAYAFAGKPGVSMNCGVASYGVAYEALAMATKGEVFDICETDWTANFAKLVENVVRLASNKFPLKNPAGAKIESVELDGVAIAPDTFTFDGKAVVVHDEDKLIRSKVVKITYRRS